MCESCSIYKCIVASYCWLLLNFFTLQESNFNHLKRTAFLWWKRSSSTAFIMPMWNKVLKLSDSGVRHYSKSKIQPPRVVRVTNHIACLGHPKEGPKPRQLLSLPPFPGHPLPGKNSASGHVTAISWLKYYFDDIPGDVIHSHFNKGLVSVYP